MEFLKNAAKSVLGLTPYEIRKRPDQHLPLETLSAVEMVLAYYMASGRPLNYVQIGACDGSANDPAYKFTRSGKIRAWLVEPIPSSFAALRRNYEGVPNVTLVHAGVADQDGELLMYRVKPEGRWMDSVWAPQWSSMNKEHIIKHGVLPEEIEEIRVPGLTLQSLIAAQGIKSIDLLQIDVEGYDAKVVEMALSLAPLPECINFEHVHLAESQVERIYPLLTEHGYQFVHDRWNSLAVHQGLLEKWA